MIRTRRRAAIAACSLALAAWPAPAAAQVEPAVERASVFAGHTLVLPVVVRTAPEDPGAVPVRLGGFETTGRLAAASRELVLDDPWLGPRVRARWAPWASGTAGEGPAAGVLLIDAPAEGAARTLAVDGAAIPVAWFPRGRPGANNKSDGPVAREDAVLSRREVEPMLGDPGLRWRARLALGRLGRDVDASAERHIAEPVPRAIAAHAERRAAAALERAGVLDGDLLEDVRGALVSAVRFPREGGGPRAVPLLPASAAQAERLIAGLLHRGWDAEDVRAWLAEVPTAAAWPTGTVAAASGLVAQVGLLSWGRVPGLLEHRGAAVGYRPRSGVAGVAAIPIRAGDGVALLDRGVGRVVAGLATRPLTAGPPGLTLGPLLSSWTARTLPRGVGRAAAAPTSGRLRRVPGGGWEVVVICAPAGDLRSGGGAADAGGVVRLWLGRPGDAATVVELAPAGRAEVLRSGLGDPTRVAVSAVEGGLWGAAVGLPPGAIADGPDGARLVHLAIERIDERGRRSTWPHATLPWRSRPGPAVADLSRWDGGLPGPERAGRAGEGVSGGR